MSQDLFLKEKLERTEIFVITGYIDQNSSHGLFPADIHVRLDAQLVQQKAHWRLLLQAKSLGHVAHLTLGVATAQGGVDKHKLDGEGDAGEGEEETVELVHHEAEG